MRRGLACLSALVFSACSTDALREIENNESTTGPALAAQKLAFDGGCLSYVFGDKPLRDVMAAMPEAKSIPVKDTRSPTATEAWRIGSLNNVFVMQLPNGTSCSASVMMGDPQRLHDAAITMIQSRAAFTKGMVDASERRDAERETWCTAGLYPYVAVLYRRTTGARDAFLANVFKAQGATFSHCSRGSLDDLAAVPPAPPAGSFADAVERGLRVCSAVISGLAPLDAAAANGFTFEPAARAADSRFGQASDTGIVDFFGANTRIHTSFQMNPDNPDLVTMMLVAAEDGSKCETVAVGRGDIGAAFIRGIAGGAAWVREGQDTLRRANGDRLRLNSSTRSNGLTAVDVKMVRGRRT